MFVTFAQNYEDVFLQRCFGHLDVGRWIDVGAWLPELDSVTKALSLQGWTGINIEPVPRYFDELVARRPNDINLNCAIGKLAGTTTINHIPETGLSTVHAHLAAEAELLGGVTAEHLHVDIRTLNDVCEQYLGDQDLHFVKIDVEGSEDDVLAGFDLHRYRPWVLIIESNLPNSTQQSYAHWEPEVLAADYEFVFYDGLNRWFISKEHSELRRHFEFPLYLFRTIMTSAANDDARTHEAAYKELAATNAELSARIRVLETNLAANQSALEEVRASRSWKITAPIRQLTKRRLIKRQEPRHR